MVPKQKRHKLDLSCLLATPKLLEPSAVRNAPHSRSRRAFGKRYLRPTTHITHDPPSCEVCKLVRMLSVLPLIA